MESFIGIDLGLDKTSAVFAYAGEKDLAPLKFSSGTYSVYTAIHRNSLTDDWRLVYTDKDWDDKYVYSHFIKVPELLTKREKELARLFFYLLWKDLKETNKLPDEKVFGAVCCPIFESWSHLDTDSFDDVYLKDMSVRILNCSHIQPWHKKIDFDSAFFDVKNAEGLDGYADFLVGIDFGDGETAASCYDLSGLRTNENSEKLFRLSFSPSGTDYKIFSALKHSLGSICNTWELIHNEEDFCNSELKANFKNAFSSNKCQSELMFSFWQLVFNTLLKHNDFLKYNSDLKTRNFFLATACPSSWSEDDALTYRSKMIRAGIPVDIMLRESDAAFYKWEKQIGKKETLIIDYGSSTIDVSWVRDGYSSALPLKLDSMPGAGDIEKNMVRLAMEVDESFVKKCSKLEDYISSHGINYDVNEAVKLCSRLAKEIFFSRESNSISVSLKDKITRDDNGYLSGGRIVDLEWEKAYFEDNVIKPYQVKFEEFLSALKLIIDKAGIRPEKIILSGGASRMPFVREYVYKKIGSHLSYDDLFHDRSQADFVVSDGLALALLVKKDTIEPWSVFWKFIGQYEDYSEAMREFVTDWSDPNNPKDVVVEPSLFGVQINGKWGWIDKHNNLVIPAIYDQTYPFCNNGIIVLEKDGKCGAIYKKDGSIAFDFIYGCIGQVYKDTYLLHKMSDWKSGVPYGALAKPKNRILTSFDYAIYNEPCWSRTRKYAKRDFFGTSEGTIDLETGKEL